jgi:lysophospholipid acyltransferase
LLRVLTSPHPPHPVSAQPYGNVRHIFGLIVGAFFGFVCLGPTAPLHALASGGVAYVLALVVSPKWAHYAIFLWSFAYMSAAHIYRMYTDYLGWTLDFTGPQMIITLKLCSLGFNLADGHRVRHRGRHPDQNKRVVVSPSKARDGATDEHPDMYDYWVDHAIDEVPSLLEWFSFLFFFGGYLAGPFFEFKDYRDLVSGRLFHDAPGQKCPSPWWPMLRTLAMGLACTVPITLAGSFPMSYASTPEFLSHNIVYRHVYCSISFILIRFNYYFAWLLAEGACILAGLGYNGLGRDAKARWDRVTNVRIHKVETAQAIAVVTSNWNMQVNVFLKNYAYLRITPKGARPQKRAIYYTYLLSGFWHGFYFGYYVTFASAAAFDTVSKTCRRRVRPFFVDPTTGKGRQPWKLLYDIVTFFAVAIGFGYCGGPFTLLSAEASWFFLKDVFHFDIHLLCIPLVILFMLLPEANRSDHQKAH